MRSLHTLVANDIPLTSQLALYNGLETVCGGEFVYFRPDEYITYGAKGLSDIRTKSQGEKEISIFDHLGSVRCSMKQDGTLIGYRDYEPFGAPLSAKQEKTRLGFIDKEQDKESSLADHGVRKYDYETGRFMSCDALWSEYLSLSTYSYSANCPLIIKDDNGNDFVICIDMDTQAGSEGHAKLYFQDNGGNWWVYSQGAKGDVSTSGALLNNDYDAHVNIERVSEKQIPNNWFSLRFHTTRNQDILINISALESQYEHNKNGEKYNLYSNNCKDAVVNVINNSGVTKIDNNNISPKDWYYSLRLVLGGQMFLNEKGKWIVDLSSYKNVLYE